ncbi:hypothetical protein EMPS_00328 [Entomortierella parvispora]|uniref:Uncharacterized protein n=1 Tax=Entomortierella parvispora TaxID=205924 RepID=A0A9P3H1H8_9FUNG|nr:hypothetical protein EMPS_00328 [Entomortierella parvispora]
MPVLADDQPSPQLSSRLSCASLIGGLSSHVYHESCQRVSVVVCKAGDHTKAPTCDTSCQEYPDRAKEPSTQPHDILDEIFTEEFNPGHPSMASSIEVSSEDELNTVAAIEVDPSRPRKYQSLVGNEMGKGKRRQRRKKTKSTTIGRFEVSREYFTSSSTTPGGGSRNMSDHSQSRNGSSRDKEVHISKRKDEWIRMLDFSMTRYASPSCSSAQDIGELSGGNLADLRQDGDVLFVGKGTGRSQHGHSKPEDPDRPCNNAFATTRPIVTAPVAIPKPFLRMIPSSVESSWTTDEDAPSLGSLGSLDPQVPNNSYDEFGSSSSSFALFNQHSAHPPTFRPLIDFDEVVASRRPDWIASRRASISPAESTSSSSSSSPIRRSSGLIETSLEATWRAFDSHIQPSILLTSAEAEILPVDPETRLANNSGDSSLPYYNRVATAMPLVSSPQQRLPSRWLGARLEERTNLPLWSHSPLTLTQCFTSRSNSFSSSTKAVLVTDTSATTAATMTHSRPTMTSSLAQALAKLTSSAAAASREDDSSSEPEFPYEGPTLQPKLRSIRAKVPVVTYVPEEFYPEFAAVMDEGIISWSGQSCQDSMHHI